MPIYEYACLSCGKKFERIVRLSESDQPQECPACRSTQSQRKVSTFASFGSSSGGSGGGSSSGCGSSGGRFT